MTTIVVPYVSTRPGDLACYWASRALHDPDLSTEDREMALAAYSRAFDVRMGTVGKSVKGGIREIFPHGDEFLRRAP